MKFVQLSRRSINLEFLIGVEHLDDPPGAARVTMVSGTSWTLGAADAAILDAAIAQADAPSPPPGATPFRGGADPSPPEPADDDQPGPRLRRGEA